MDIVTSKNGIPIRLTEERWVHITENHDDLAGHYDDVIYQKYTKKSNLIFSSVMK